MKTVPTFRVPHIPAPIPDFSRFGPQIVQGDAFVAAFTNLRWFGGTTLWGDKNTAMYVDDDLRSRYFPESLTELFKGWPTDLAASSLPGLWGFSELWDKKYQSRFLNSDPWRHHQYYTGPFGEGLPEILGIIRKESPLLHAAIGVSPDAFVKNFARSQLIAGAAQLTSKPMSPWGLTQMINRYVRPKLNEKLDKIMTHLEKMVEGQKFFGSGVALAVKPNYKILNKTFIPFTSKNYGLDRYARKGILCVDVELPNGKRVSVFVIHFHVGESELAKQARWQQVEQFKPILQAADYPAVIVLDSNETAEIQNLRGEFIASEEYLKMLRTLGLKDAFRTMHPNATDMPGFTYDDATHFSKILEIACDPQSLSRFQRLDGIWYGPGLEPLFAETFPLTHPDYTEGPLTDHHRMVVAAFGFS
jgi:hypothetical protein